MATDEVVTLPVCGEHGTQSIQLPDGWIESTQVQARRIGRQIVLEPVVPDVEPPHEDDEVEYRYVNGRPVHPSWPPGYIEWLHTAQARGEFANDDVERMDIELRDTDDVP